MMFKTLGICVFLLALSLPAYSADLYGKVYVSPDSRPAAGANVSTSCGKGSSVDRAGRYRLRNLPNNTSCSISVTHQSKTGTTSANSGSGSKIMNIELQASGNQWKLITH